MSVVSSLYTGASGLTAHGDALSVVGDNIANANTIGYKSSRANFEDVLANSVGGVGNDIGLGSKLAQVQKILTQGTLLGTGVATDLAIKGDGYFAVKGSAAGLQGQFYTRAGQFILDKDGYMVNSDELKVQGYVIDQTTGTLVKSVTDVKVENSSMPPVATTTSQIAGNLDSTTSTPAQAFTVGAGGDWAGVGYGPEDASNFSSSMTVYDSLGNDHSATVYFRNDGATGWSWSAMVDGGEVGGTAGVMREIGSGAITFDTAGAIATGGTGTLATTFTGAAASSINIDLTNVTQYASQSTVTYLDQNGYGSGSLSGISIGSDGIVTGVFSNGQQRTVAQVLLADFSSPDAMQRIGGNLYIETQKSGTALVGEAASGGRGVISAGALEQSNVDLAQQFVDMIAFQRGFQSNSKTVQTADQMLQTLIGLKR
jgi:flagellar hook protein FlgE